MKKKRREYDILWKGVVEEVFGELLEFVFPDHVDVFDLDRGVTFLDKELGELFPQPDKRSEVRHVDKLVKVFRKDGTDEYLLVHVEVQGKYDEDFARRMFEYYCRLYMRFKRPIEAVAIFTDREGLRMPDHCEQVALVTRMRLDYQSLYLAKWDDSVLEASPNPFAWLLLAAREVMIRGRDKEQKLFDHKMLVFRHLLRNGVMEKPKLQAILGFLETYVPFENPETLINFRNAVDHETGKTNTMGILEQIREIKLQEAAEDAVDNTKRQIVKTMLAKGTYSIPEIAEVVDEDVDFVIEVKNEL